MRKAVFRPYCPYLQKPKGYIKQNTESIDSHTLKKAKNEQTKNKLKGKLGTSTYKN